MATLPEHLRSSPSGREPVSREVLHEHQRERVLVKAIPVFARRGYNGTTVDDLLAAGKVGVANFYELFAGKEDCFTAAYERILSEAREAAASAAAGQEDWAARTYLGLRALIDFGLARPLESRLLLIEAQSAGEEALGRYNALLDEALAWLRRGREESRGARGLPRGFERASVSGLAFYLQQCLREARAQEPEELFGEVSELILEPILGAPALARLRQTLAVPA
jgi:AcrR family transcriptional regulator